MKNQDTAARSSSFSLLRDPWIPVLFADGSQQDLSMLAVFEEAHRIRTINGDIPQQLIPILRVLEAFLYGSLALPEPSDGFTYTTLWKEIWESGQFPIRPFQDYAQQVEAHFFLIDAKHPFYQVAGLEYMGGKEFDPIESLLADIPKPEKFLFSQRAKGSIESLSLAEAARWLIFMQAYDLAGIKSPLVGSSSAKSGKQYAPKGAVGTGLLGSYGPVFGEGKNFFETLMLNWVPVLGGQVLAGDEDDLPIWERETAITDVVANRHPAGIMDLLTWPARRIRLIPDESQKRIIGYISGYGDIPTVVNSFKLETMSQWRKSKEQAKRLGVPEAFMPKAHDPARALWRGAASLLGGESQGIDTAAPIPGVMSWAQEVHGELAAKSDSLLKTITIHAQGIVYGSQNSAYEDGIDDVLDINVDLLRQDTEAVYTVIEVVQSADKAVSSLVWFVQNVRIAEGSRNPASDSDRVRETAYDSLDAIFRRRIAQFSEDKERLSYRQEWQDEIHRELLNLANQYVVLSSASPFVGGADEDSPMTSAKAMLWLRSALIKALGHLPGVGQKQQGATDNGGDVVAE